MNMNSLLVVEDDSAWRSTLVDFFELEGFRVESAASTREAMARLEQQPFPIVVSDIYLDERTGLDVLRAARKANDSCAVILMTGRGSMETVMAATEGNVFEYLAKPVDLDRLLATVKRAQSSLVTADDLVDDDPDDLPETELIGFSPVMVNLYKEIARVAKTDATVLLQGETGTGKELVARQIHRMSLRSAAPFVPVDCGAIAASLLESELFGAMRGAYTGADRDRVGVFEAANHGTVLLDEIGDIDHGFQLKLLRFLQERQVRPLGSSRVHAVDVRIVAATHRDVAKMVDEEKFREDLWFRLNVVPIAIPPLRERAGDIDHLARFYLRKYNERYKLSAKLTESGLKELENYTWPGNVRQLQHLVERLTILAPYGRIDADAVRFAIEEAEPRDNGSETLADAEAEQIRRVMAATNGNKSRAARILGIERKTLYRKLEKMGLA
ncbi:MAG: sigma-54-dependent Fis family transcriptional regulator [Acidobacteria bacterium]|nr:sigma-54-dependent Fis family transcriptional regulator [Acidobacteriota bacterium]